MAYTLSNEEKAELARVELIKRDVELAAAQAAQATQAVEKEAVYATYRDALAAKTDAEVKTEYDTCKAAEGGKA